MTDINSINPEDNRLSSENASFVEAADEHAQPSTVERVGHGETTAAEILSGVGATNVNSLKLLSPTQEAGMKLAWAVGIAIVVVIIFVCLDWLLTIPHNRPDINASRDAIDNYKEMRTSAIEDASKLFDLIVAKALLPVFTAILGYIFGSREAMHSGGEGS